MTRKEQEAAARKLRTAFELFETGVAMMRQTLRRKHADLDEDQIEELLAQWLRHRPGAEHGDADGRPGTWPRESRSE